MALSISTFRTLYPEFTDSGKYPDAAITQWLTVAALSLNAERWLSLLDLGTGLFVAHNLVLGVQNIAASARGGVPGQQTGPLSAKSAGGISASYDTQACLIDNAGHWNLSTYGARYIQLARCVGAGATVC